MRPRAKSNAEARLTLEICILAGGRSSRMGRDKSRLRLGRRTLLGQILATAKQFGCPVRIIKRDSIPRCGPIGGVYTALSTSRANTVLFLSNDMPFVSVNLLRRLKALSKPGIRGAFVTAKGCAGFPFLLSREALAVVEKHISNKQFSLQELAAALNAHAPRLQRRAPELFNVNTPDDWAVARRRWQMLRNKKSS